MREAGIEVWLDQRELVGGDAWDAKIRKQIQTCELFITLISAETQARREGYYRREWKQAAARTRDMADGTPFILPVVIDATRDADALVPEEFRAVQWTRLAGSAPTTQFVVRVKTLLGGEGVARAFQRVSTDSETDFTRSKAHATPAARKRSVLWVGAALATIIAIGITATFIATRMTGPSTSTNSKPQTPNPKPQTPNRSICRPTNRSPCCRL